jgi:hypothetical protein
MFFRIHFYICKRGALNCFFFKFVFLKSRLLIRIRLATINQEELDNMRFAYFGIGIAP